MRNLSFIILILFSAISFAGGGVDVGNGTSRVVLVHTSHAFSEPDLEKILRTTIKDLRTNRLESLRFAVQKAKCSEKVKINGVDQDKSYKINDSHVVLQRRYKGIIQVQVDNCKKPNLLPDEIRN